VVVTLCEALLYILLSVFPVLWGAAVAQWLTFISLMSTIADVPHR